MMNRCTPPATLCLTLGMRLPFAVSAIVWIAAMGGDPARGGNLPAKVEFNRDVRPILSDNCFLCHGPDKNRRKADLRLDLRDEAIEAGAIVPGKPEESELVERILSDRRRRADAAAEVEQEARPARQKEILKRWVEQGAEYQKHWSYERPVKAEIPAGQNAVDVLVRRRLAEVGLKPSPEADRRTLIRRLSSDLTRPAAVARGGPGVRRATVSPDAYERLVERLLASPHYGERMAIGWLDVVRFADTIGYHSDNPRNIWPYRDWVIKSFNDNKPFDRFTVEQIAGDLLPDASVETRVGSAFNRLLLSTEEGGAQAKDYEARMLTDRVRAVGAVWLGQTTGCASATTTSSTRSRCATSTRSAPSSRTSKSRSSATARRAWSSPRPTTRRPWRGSTRRWRKPGRVSTPSLRN